ncbi:TusE/DsrC/DsvC family sulfur relay protein [Thioalkalivibrio sulfidiphilus]|uniref:TusE/DsrC/DsvC family sulfur relay protein n=1 Tax=Thioalkalivibrio sulfidiphilus TaxID=1033854 RepID=UPI0003AA3050|nr:TusE/DsrC/DsvC family sulfur relay protein [Thioalkalivibrio sulfidiphilus]
MWSGLTAGARQIPFRTRQARRSSRAICSGSTLLRRQRPQAVWQRLYELFPYGYMQQVCKIAGMRRPRAWSTG